MKAPRRNGVVLAILLCVVGGMTALSFASVPLYRLFCQVTGYGGTPQIAATTPDRTCELIDPPSQSSYRRFLEHNAKGQFNIKCRVHSRQ